MTGVHLLKTDIGNARIDEALSTFVTPLSNIVWYCFTSAWGFIDGKQISVLNRHLIEFYNKKYIFVAECTYDGLIKKKSIGYCKDHSV